jgi:hypothetical protein
MVFGTYPSTHPPNGLDEEDTNMMVFEVLCYLAMKKVILASPSSPTKRF